MKKVDKYGKCAAMYFLFKQYTYTDLCAGRYGYNIEAEPATVDSPKEGESGKQPRIVGQVRCLTQTFLVR